MVGRLPDLLKQTLHLKGADCNIRKILAVVSNLVIKSNDTIVVYYAGHGGHDTQLGTIFFPGMDGGQGLPLHSIRDQLAAKQPRLSVFLIDCCQTPIDGRVTQKRKQYTAGKILEVPLLERSLFFDSPPGMFFLYAAERGVAVPCGVPGNGSITVGTLFSDAIALVRDENPGGIGWVEFGKRIKYRVAENFNNFPRDGSGRIILSPGNQHVEIPSQRVWALRIPSGSESEVVIEP